MEYWEFLIQREGDRGWRTIETGNLQLMEGKYRIVANSDLINTQVQIRLTHQTPGLTVPQRRSQSRTQTTNPRGLLAIIPFTNLQSGIWQFVCTGTTAAQVSWQHILKLRVLPRIPKSAPMDVNQPSTAITSPVFPTRRDRFELPIPTAPIVPISMVGAQENYADGLDRLLEQLERESLQPQPPAQPPQPKVIELIPGAIQLTQIFDSPSQLINLNRSTFYGIIPGNPLTISGSCNLAQLNGKLIKAVKVEKLSICLRHPHTAEIIGSIEQSLPPQLDTFTFSGDLELPTTAQIGFLIGEVSLYDKHNIQLGSHGFTVTLSLDPIEDDKISLFQLPAPVDSTAELLAQLTAELQLESVTIGSQASLVHQEYRSIPAPTAPAALSFTHPDILPVKSASSQSSAHLDITGDLEIDFALTSFGDRHQSSNYDNLEIVVDN